MKIAIIDKFCNNHNAFSKQIKFQGHEVSYLTNVGDLSKFDVVHFDWADDLAILGTNIISKLRTKPRVSIRLHAYEVHEDYWMSNINWNVVDSIIFVSQHYHDLFVNKVKIDQSKLHVVHHGIDLDKFKFVEHKGNDILYVGSINFKKGPQLLAQAALALPNQQFHIYGDIQCERSKIYFDHLKLPNLTY
jgi:glycosyltransferase involved in cell wall biosynthesis